MALPRLLVGNEAHGPPPGICNGPKTCGIEAMADGGGLNMAVIGRLMVRRVNWRSCGTSFFLPS